MGFPPPHIFSVLETSVILVKCALRGFYDSRANNTEAFVREAQKLVTFLIQQVLESVALNSNPAAQRKQT